MTERADNYERVVLYQEFREVSAGKATRSESYDVIVVMRCNTCFSLVQVDDVEDHSRHHDRVAQQAKFQARLNNPNRLIR